MTTTRTAGVESQSSLPVVEIPPAVPPTTYCYRHNGLETVDHIEKVRPFIVEIQRLGWPTMPFKTDRSACEVWGFTTAGCGVHFIGGARWNR